MLRIPTHPLDNEALLQHTHTHTHLHRQMPFMSWWIGRRREGRGGSGGMRREEEEEESYGMEAVTCPHRC